MNGILRYLWRRKVRTALTVLAVAVGIFAVTAVGSIAEQLEEVVQATEQDAYSRIRVWAPDYVSQSSEATVRHLRRIDGVAGVVVKLSGRLEKPENSVVRISFNPPMFTGVRSDLPELTYEPPVQGLTLAAGRLPAAASRTETVVTWTLAQDQGLAVGDTLLIRERPFRVVGLWSDSATATGRVATISYEAAEDLLGVGAIRDVWVVPQPGTDVEALAERIGTEMGEINASSPAETAREARQQVMIFSAIVGASGVTSLLIGSLTIINTMVVSVQERRREIGLKKAVGAEDRYILVEIIVESSLIALAGGLLGVMAGGGVGYVANTTLYGQLGMALFRLTPRLALGAVGFSVLIGAVSGFYPALRAARVNPVVALRGVGGEVTSMVGLGIRGVIRAVRQNMRSVLTIGGIAIGVFTLVLLGTLTEALNGYLGDIAAGTDDLLMLSPKADATAINHATARQIRRLPGVRDAIFTSYNELPINPSGEEGEETPHQVVWAFESETDDMGAAMIVDTAIAKGRRWGPGDATEVVLGAGLAEAQHVQVGDEIVIQDRPFTVVGIWARMPFDIAEHDMAAFLTMRGLERATGETASTTNLSVRAESPAAVQALATTIETEVPGVQVQTTAEVFGEIRQVFGVLIAVMVAVFSIAVFVGGVSVVNTMVIAVNEKTREIGLKKAVGAEDGDILAEVLMEAGKLGALGGAAGTLAAWGTTRLLNPLIRVQLGADILYLSPRLAIGAVVFSLLLGTISGLLPARRAARLDPVVALRSE